MKTISPDSPKYLYAKLYNFHIIPIFTILQKNEALLNSPESHHQKLLYLLNTNADLCM